MAAPFDVHAHQISWWRAQLLEGGAEVFGGDSRAEAPPPIDAAAPIDATALRAKIAV